MTGSSAGARLRGLLARPEPLVAPGAPSARANAAAAGRNENSALGLPLGRPRWDMTMTRAPLPASSRRPGTVRSMASRRAMWLM